jgi:hypothetical protein
MIWWRRSSGLVRLAGHRAIRQPLFRRQLFRGGLRQPLRKLADDGNLEARDLLTAIAAHQLPASARTEQ